jgi:hypothetical protein
MLNDKNMRQPTKWAYLMVVVLLITLSCGQDQGKPQNQHSVDQAPKDGLAKDSVIKNGNVTVTISSDLEKLGQLLDFKQYKPMKVKFRYTFIDNAGQNDRLSVPGPSDYALQAVLYFDTLTFNSLLEYDQENHYPAPNHNREEFRFDWLDKEILTELGKASDSYRGHPDLFFGTANGKLWYLDRKILITQSSN